MVQQDFDSALVPEMFSNPSAAVNVRGAARAMELTEQDGRLTYVEAVLEVQPLKLSTLQVPVVVNRPPGNVRIQDVPMEPDPHGTSLAQFADVILDHPFPDQAARDELERICSTKQFQSLPEPYRLKREPTVPYTMQFFFVPDANEGKCTLLKHVLFQPNKVNVSLIKAM